MPGVGVHVDRQLSRLREIVLPFLPEYRANTAFHEGVAGAFGPGFGPIEAQTLHGFIRGTKPARVVEVGSGISTYCMLEAAKLNSAEGAPVQITCVEPYPSAWLRSAPVHLVAERVEQVSMEVFEALEAGDLLFIDSTHAIRVGGDVMQIILEILPRLKPGVFVHFHDIYFPFDYQRDADRSIFQWMETAMLHAYLVGNTGMDIVFCLSQLHYDRPDGLRQVFPDYDPEPGNDGLRPVTETGTRDFPSSIYLQTTMASGRNGPIS